MEKELEAKGLNPYLSASEKQKVIDYFLANPNGTLAIAISKGPKEFSTAVDGQMRGINDRIQGIMNKGAAMTEDERTELTSKITLLGALKALTIAVLQATAAALAPKQPVTK